MVALINRTDFTRKIQTNMTTSQRFFRDTVRKKKYVCIPFTCKIHSLSSCCNWSNGGEIVLKTKVG